jgi:hypothetical protein
MIHGLLEPGEDEAIKTAIELSEQYGYGRMIQIIESAWSEKLQREQKLSARTADMAARIICVWCHTDCRTGKKSPTPRTGASHD